MYFYSQDRIIYYYKNSYSVNSNSVKLYYIGTDFNLLSFPYNSTRLRSLLLSFIEFRAKRKRKRTVARFDAFLHLLLITN